MKNICSDHRGKLRNRYGVCTAACSRGVSSGTGCTQRGPVTGTGAGITKEGNREHRDIGGFVTKRSLLSPDAADREAASRDID